MSIEKVRPEAEERPGAIRISRRDFLKTAAPAWERYTYDPQRARQLAQEAEAEGAGRTISITTTTGNALRETLQEMMQQQLKDAGIELKIDNESATTLFSETMPEGDFELALDAWLSTPDPSTITSLYSADQIPRAGLTTAGTETSGSRIC